MTHECDFPPGVERLPHLTRSRIPADAPSAAIDAMVAEQGGSLYELDGALLAELRPDLILTQAQCDVCAVNEADGPPGRRGLARRAPRRERQPDRPGRGPRDVPPRRRPARRRGRRPRP